MGEFVKPTFQTNEYNPKNCVAIRDRWQQFLYIKHMAYPIDMYVSGDDLVMVFDREKTRDLYEKYRRYELK